MTTLFVIDIDGTIANAERRFKAAGPEPKRDDQVIYRKWVAKVQDTERLLSDPQVPGMLDLLLSLPPLSTIYLTSREEAWRGVTREWLRVNKFPQHRLHMRPNGNWDEGPDFKETVIKNLMQHRKNVVLVDDDEHDLMRHMCAKNGWTFLKACSGGQSYKVTK